MAAMDIARRQQIQQVLEEALRQDGFIALQREGGHVTTLRCDLICELTHVEGTDRDGAWVSVPYEDIQGVRVTH
ncbi:MAG: hypothetical protein JOZ70_06955 [Pseudolabrys sp.]|nr:hypothetical protein [Pseudolabrys sp.]